MQKLENTHWFLSKGMKIGISTNIPPDHEPLKFKIKQMFNIVLSLEKNNTLCCIEDNYGNLWKLIKSKGKHNEFNCWVFCLFITRWRWRSLLEIKYLFLFIVEGICLITLYTAKSKFKCILPILPTWTKLVLNQWLFTEFF